MLTRRENLLVRPWQERKYINHRIKVETALPAIDNSPPAIRQHVNWKLKKFQREKERCTQIVSDNFTLLQHLDYIRRTSRVDNAWDEPPPNFLNRVGIYSNGRRVSSDSNDNENLFDEPKTRKERCYGCSPERYIVKQQIPEERIPFDPPKKRVSSKLSSPFENDSKKVEKESESKRMRRVKGSTKDQERPQGASKRLPEEMESRKARRARRVLHQQSQQVLLSRGPLTVRLLFPTDAGLVFNDRGQQRVLSRQFCHCKALKSKPLRFSSVEQIRDSKSN